MPKSREHNAAGKPLEPQVDVSPMDVSSANTEFLRRLVQPKTEADLDTLEHGAVLTFRNVGPRVFDRREDKFMVFYYPHVLDPGKVMELKGLRDRMSVSGNMVDIISSAWDELRELTVKDGEYFTTRHADLRKLGLIK
jgi:hypothetical protein